MAQRMFRTSKGAVIEGKRSRHVDMIVDAAINPQSFPSPFVQFLRLGFISANFNENDNEKYNYKIKSHWVYANYLYLLQINMLPCNVIQFYGRYGRRGVDTCIFLSLPV
jgi:hypothetical protein